MDNERSAVQLVRLGWVKTDPAGTGAVVRSWKDKRMFENAFRRQKPTAVTAIQEVSETEAYVSGNLIVRGHEPAFVREQTRRAANSVGRGLAASRDRGHQSMCATRYTVASDRASGGGQHVL